MTAPEYVEFDLTISGSWDTGFTVDADIEGYKPKLKLNLPENWNAGQLGNVLSYFKESAEGIKRGTEAADLETRAETFGTRLFDAVITDKIAVQYGIHRSAQRPVRVRLNIDAPELHGIPWEYLCHSETRMRLATDDATPVVRTFGMAATPGRPAAPDTLNVLLMEATGGAALDVTSEVASIEEELAPFGDIVFTRVEPTIDALEAALDSGEYHVFHFIGHGEYSDRGGRGELLLETKEDGTEVRVSATTLANTLGPHSTIRLVVLNACEGARSSERDPQSGIAQKLFKGGVDAVVAMQYQIVDEHAVAFSAGLYREIAARSPIDLAVTRARRTIQRTSDWATPVLFMRTGDGRLFDESAAAPPLAQPAEPAPAPEPPVEAVASPAAPESSAPEPAPVVAEAPPAAAAPTGTDVGSGSTATPASTSPPRRLPVIIGVIVLLVAVGAVAFVATRGGDDDETVTDDTLGDAADDSTADQVDTGQGSALAQSDDEGSNAEDETTNDAASETESTSDASTAGIDEGDPLSEIDALLAAEVAEVAAAQGVPDDFLFYLLLTDGQCVDWNPVQSAGFEAGQWNVITPCSGPRNATVIGIEFIYEFEEDEPAEWPGIDSLFFTAKPVCDALYADEYGPGREEDIYPQTPTQEEWEGELRLRETTCFLQGAPVGEPAAS